MSTLLRNCASNDEQNIMLISHELNPTHLIYTTSVFDKASHGTHQQAYTAPRHDSCGKRSSHLHEGARRVDHDTTRVLSQLKEIQHPDDVCDDTTTPWVVSTVATTNKILRESGMTRSLYNTAKRRQIRLLSGLARRREKPQA